MADQTLSKMEIVARAKADWDAERAALRMSHPEWQMPAWSRTQAWRRRPYLDAARAALEGKNDG